jgi:hypothetical protein
MVRPLIVSHRLGREFQIRGAACLNDLSPSVFAFVLGICSKDIIVCLDLFMAENDI